MRVGVGVCCRGVGRPTGGVWGVGAGEGGGRGRRVDLWLGGVVEGEGDARSRADDEEDGEEAGVGRDGAGGRH